MRIFWLWRKLFEGGQPELNLREAAKAGDHITILQNDLNCEFLGHRRGLADDNYWKIAELLWNLSWLPDYEIRTTGGIVQ